MSDFRHHVPTDDGTDCVYCGDSWPCPVSQTVQQVLAAVLDTVRPTGGEPRCCDTCAARHEAMTDAADEIEELAPWPNCGSCGESHLDVSRVKEPMAYEVGNEIVWSWLCRKCHQDAADDV